MIKEVGETFGIITMVVGVIFCFSASIYSRDISYSNSGLLLLILGQATLYQAMRK